MCAVLEIVVRDLCGDVVAYRYGTCVEVLREAEIVEVVVVDHVVAGDEEVSVCPRSDRDALADEVEELTLRDGHVHNAISAESVLACDITDCAKLECDIVTVTVDSSVGRGVKLKADKVKVIRTALERHERAAGADGVVALRVIYIKSRGRGVEPVLAVVIEELCEIVEEYRVGHSSLVCERVCGKRIAVLESAVLVVESEVLCVLVVGLDRKGVVEPSSAEHTCDLHTVNGGEYDQWTN